MSQKLQAKNVTTGHDQEFLCSDHLVWLILVSELVMPVMQASPELLRFSMWPLFCPHINLPQCYLFYSLLSWQKHRKCVLHDVLYIIQFFFRLTHQQETIMIDGSHKGPWIPLNTKLIFSFACTNLALYYCYYLKKNKNIKQEKQD